MLDKAQPPEFFDIIGYIDEGKTPKDVRPVLQYRRDRDIIILSPTAQLEDKVEPIDVIDRIRYDKFRAQGLISHLNEPFSGESFKALHQFADGSVKLGAQDPFTTFRLFAKMKDMLPVVAHALGELTQQYDGKLREMCRHEDIPRLTAQGFLRQARDLEGTIEEVGTTHTHHLKSRDVVALFRKENRVRPIAALAIEQVVHHYGTQRACYYEEQSMSRGKLSNLRKLAQDYTEEVRAPLKLNPDQVAIYLFANNHTMFPLVRDSIHYLRAEYGKYAVVSEQCNIPLVTLMRTKKKVNQTKLAIPSMENTPDPYTTMQLYSRQKAIYPRVSEAFRNQLAQHNGSVQKLSRALKLNATSLHRYIKLVS